MDVLLGKHSLFLAGSALAGIVSAAVFSRLFPLS
jgi:hypothetical protein